MSRTVSPLRDRELVRMLADEPELLAIADALVETRCQAGPAQRSRPLERRRRLGLVGAAAVLAVLAGAIAAVVAVVNPGSSNASPVRQATPLVRANVTASVRRSIAHMALRNGVAPATVVELGGSGTGRQHHAVLAGTDASGATLLSFLDGFGWSAFVPGDRFASAAHPMFVSDTVSGPSTEARIVGMTGITTSEVTRVTVQLANGTTLTLPLDQAPGVPYEGFSYVSSDASTFPARVTAYNGKGEVAAQHKVDATPLCKPSHPNCVG
jgi:hypothetical protein